MAEKTKPDILKMLIDGGLDEDNAKKAKSIMDKDIIPKNYVPSDQYNDKVLELADANETAKKANDDLIIAKGFEQKYNDEVSAHGTTKTTMQKTYDDYKTTVETEKTERETDDKIIAVQSKHKYANERTGKSLLDDIKKILKDPENKKSVEEIHTELTMDKDGKPIPGIFAKAPDMPPSGNAGGDDKPKYIPPKVL